MEELISVFILPQKNQRREKEKRRRKSRRNLISTQLGHRKVILFILLIWIILNRIFQEERKMRLVRRMFDEECDLFINFEMKRLIIYQHDIHICPITQN